MKNILFLISIFIIINFSYSQNLTSFYPTLDVSGLRFGQKVAVSNNYIAASSYYNFLFGNTPRTYIFEIDNNSIINTQSIIPNDVTLSDGFGESLDIENENLVISAHKQNSNVADSGAIYLYKKNGNMFNFIQKISSLNNLPDDNFGYKVIIYNSKLYVTSKNQLSIFEFINNSWSLNQILNLPNNNSTNFVFSIHSNTLIIQTSSNLPNGSLSIDLNIYSNIGSNNWEYKTTISEILNVQGLINDAFNFTTLNNKIYILRNHNRQIRIFDFDGINYSLNSSFNYINNNFLHNGISVYENNVFISTTSNIDSNINNPYKLPLLHYKFINNSWSLINTYYSNEEMEDIFINDSFGINNDCDNNKLIIGCQLEITNGVQYGKCYLVDINSNLSTTNLKNNSITIFPNPTNDIIYINNHDNIAIDLIEIFQIDGKKLHSEGKSFDKLNVSFLNSGTYILKISDKNGFNIYKKIIKN